MEEVAGDKCLEHVVVGRKSLVGGNFLVALITRSHNNLGIQFLNYSIKELAYHSLAIV